MSSEFRWDLGLGGAWSQVANLTAIGVICVLFILSWRDSQKEREHCRKVNEELLQQVEENRQAVRSLAKQLREQKR